MLDYLVHHCFFAQHAGSLSSASPKGAAPDTHPCGWCLTCDTNSRARPSQQSYKGPQGATPETRPLAPPPVGRRPQSIATPLDRGFLFLHAQSSAPLRVTPLQGPLRGGTAGQHQPSTLGLLYPDAKLRCPPWTTQAQHRLPVLLWLPTGSLPRANLSVQVSTELVTASPHTQQRGSKNGTQK